MAGSCRLIIEDEVNIKLEGVDVDVRRKLANALKFEVPYARYMPQYKLGRWDGKVAFFGIGGTGYVNHLNVVSEVLAKNNVQIVDIEDRRHPVKLDFSPITERYWADQGVRWPKGHPAEGEEIILRDYQVEAINNFIANPQSLQEIATGAGKTITTATLSHLSEPYGRSIVIVPNKSLVEQTEEDYINCGLDVGVYIKIPSAGIFFYCSCVHYLFAFRIRRALANLFRVRVSLTFFVSFRRLRADSLRSILSAWRRSLSSISSYAICCMSRPPLLPLHVLLSYTIFARMSTNYDSNSSNNLEA